ncbi:hypothetical protein PVK06_034941 [Gossypium arboreum]|uniref:Retrovirus-related Pol polyprotein from transposon TNT 1-94 n=1 Tax=Gossypium arboreum TaxID=29729 RepID=A0ABR0NFK6_GOSAR|nr:hypothetical protein PVK06_034941 [Gossypium arboreum]
MATTRFEIEKFDGAKNFNLWQVWIMAILVQTGLKKVVTEKKPENLNQTEREELDKKALSFRETLIYGKEKLSFEDVKGHLLSRDKLENEFGLDSKADKQASVLVAPKK